MDEVRTALSEGRIDLPRTGEVRPGDRASMPYVVVDAGGAEIDAIGRYLRDLALGDVSPLTCRSYAHDLLRWWRNQRSRSIAYDRCVVAGRPIACKSFKYTATGTTTRPPGSTSRYGSHTSPVSRSAPALGTSSAARSRASLSSSITSRDHSQAAGYLSAELGNNHR